VKPAENNQDVGPLDQRSHALAQPSEQARALADQLDNLEAKQTMRRIADDYERLAKRAEERAAGRWPQNHDNR
jgi:hypothetical protein